MIMDEKTLKEIIEFSKATGKLKKVRRTGWGMRVGIKDAESVADHTFRTAIMAMVIADARGFDTEKVMRMALMHDLGETIIGDWDALQTKLDGRVEEKQRKENEALRKILFMLPKELEEKYVEVWEELVAGETEESRLFSQVDRLETIMQALEYEKEGYGKERFEAFWGAKRSVKDPDLVKIVEILEKERAKIKDRE
jgi:putative hydrolase of HD superfamily